MYHFNKRLLEHILANLNDTLAIQLYNGQSKDQPWDYHIFLVDSFEAFDEIRWNFPQTFYERNFRFLIVLTKFTPEYLPVLERIFSSCRRFHVINANIVLQHPSLGVYVFKYELFTAEKCHLVQPYLFFRFKDNLKEIPKIFPRKLFNFYGCPLRITARSNPPFVTFSGNKSNPVCKDNTWTSLSGMDGELIKLLARNLNFTINLLPFPRGDTFFVNYTGFGCFAELLHGRADIGIGGFSASNPKRLVLTVSDVYQISPVVFIIRGGRELDPISRLVSPFELDVWIYLTVFLIFGTIMIAFLRYTSLSVQTFVFGEEISCPMTNFFAVFLGYPMNRLPLRNFARFVLLVWLLSSLVLRNAYQGSLFDSFRMDRFSHIPKGYNELMAWDYKILVSKYIEDSETFPKSGTITVFGGHGARLRYLERKHGRYATIALRDNFMSYMENNYRNGSKLIMVEETVYLHSAAMFLPKHSMYAASINRYLRLFNDAGITRYLAKNNAKDKKIFKRHKNGYDVPLEAITCYRLLGVFEISGALLLLATVIFVLELLSVKWKKLEGFINIIS
ncbi:uncharacterized protein LOC129944779 [Eupeodes corollae]|uniref:uncharacterized protein LOC129944779 n=1 Tax=Eupeodes corollae TaxID=290404 RepID=UPI0024908AB5|nr:uncharacterized protein LOC129944779 [Eupeodes corollae]